MNISIEANNRYSLCTAPRAGAIDLTQARWDAIIAFNKTNSMQLQYARIDPVTLIPYIDTAAQLLDIQKAKEAEIRTAAAQAIEAIATPYHQQERDTWFRQTAEAEAWTASNTAVTPLIDAILAARKLIDATATKAAIVSNILAKRDAFNAAVGTIIGKQQGLLTQVYAVNTTVASVQAIIW